jgi:hypothetical protein
MFSSAVMLSACGEVDGGSNTSAAEIRAQEAVWRDAIIDDYDLLYKVRCLCPPKDRFVKVRAGRIERVEYNWATDGTLAGTLQSDPTGLSAPVVDPKTELSVTVGATGHVNATGHYYGDYYHEDYVYTVDRLFDIVKDAHSYAHAVNVTWHPSLGFPTELRIDWNYNGIDDEYQILIIDFYIP